MTEQYLRGEISQNDLLGFASFQAFEASLQQAGSLDKTKVLPQGVSKHLQVHVRSYNSFGSCEKKGQLDAKKLIVVRMQLKNIQSETVGGLNLGSVVYAQSYCIIESRTFICLTKCIPSSLVWQTDNMHYRNMPLP